MEDRTMRFGMLWLAGMFALLLTSSAFASGARNAFGFESSSIQGIGSGEVFLTGGGAYLLPDFVHSGGAFRCLADVQQGPLKGCLAGEGIRWDTAELLASTSFKCTGADTVKTASTGEDTVVLLADFYRQ